MPDKDLWWKNLGSEAGPELPLFNVRYDRLQHPTSDDEFKRLVLDTPDWVNVVAVTGNGELVMVEQYRFGIGDLSLEPVGGIVDPGENSEQAAKRELLEETGYGGGEWHYLGAVNANPAFHNNDCHMWLAQGVEKQQEQALDSGEAIRVHLMSEADIRKLIADGRFKHPYGLITLSRVFPIWDYPFAP